MTDQERQQFLPVVKTFTKVLEKGSADATDTKKLVQQIRELNKLIPANIGSSIQGLFGNLGSFGMPIIPNAFSHGVFTVWSEWVCLLLYFTLEIEC